MGSQMKAMARSSRAKEKGAFAPFTTADRPVLSDFPVLHLGLSRPLRRFSGYVHIRIPEATPNPARPAYPNMASRASCFGQGLTKQHANLRETLVLHLDLVLSLAYNGDRGVDKSVQESQCT
jgi:hypothetical protein